MYGLVPVHRRGSVAINNRFPDVFDMFDDFFNDGLALRRAIAVDSFKVDVQDNEGGYVVEAEIPGVSKDELDVDLRDNRLTISVRREESVEEEGKNYVHRERRRTSMSRGLMLPDASNEGVEAKLNDGVLTVSVPKVKRAEAPTKIAVS